MGILPETGLFIGTMGLVLLFGWEIFKAERKLDKKKRSSVDGKLGDKDR